MLNKSGLVVCNLPKAKLAGEQSVGMVLCASTLEGDTPVVVEFVDPPEGAEPGTPIVVEGVERNIASTSRMKKKKVWAAVQANLKVTGGVPMWQDQVLLAEGYGPCSVPTITSGILS